MRLTKQNGLKINFFQRFTRRKICACLWIIGTLFLAVLPRAFATEQQLTRESAGERALAHSEAVHEAWTAHALLVVERDKALADLAALREKEGRPSLRNILAAAEKAAKQQAKKAKKKAPPPPALPLEFALRQKIAALTDAIDAAELTHASARLTAWSGGTEAYCDALLAASRVTYRERAAAAALHALRLTREQVQIGAAPVKAITSVEDELRRAQAEKEKAVLAEQTARRILGEWIGEEIGPSAMLENTLPEIALPDKAPEALAEIAKPRDSRLFAARQAQKQATKNFAAVLGSDPNAYLQYIKEIKSYQALLAGQMISYHDFLKEYHNPRLEMAGMWDGPYSLQWMCFKADAPRAWFQPSGMSAAVAQDRRAAIFASYLLWEAAGETAAQTERALEERVMAAYEQLKARQKELWIVQGELAQAQHVGESLLIDEKLGRGEFNAARAAKLRTEELTQAAAELRIVYQQSLSAFNRASNGAIYLPEEADAPPISFAGDALWTLKTSAADPNFIFGISLPGTCDADSFQLFYGDVPIGGRTGVQAVLAAPLIEDRGSDLLRLEFYRNGALCYTASLVGSDYAGTLQLTIPEGAALSAYDKARAEKSARAAEAKALRSEYLQAVQEGKADLQKSLKAKLDRAVAAIREAEAAMQAIERQEIDKEEMG